MHSQEAEPNILFENIKLINAPSIKLSIMYTIPFLIQNFYFNSFVGQSVFNSRYDSVNEQLVSCYEPVTVAYTNRFGAES